MKIVSDEDFNLSVRCDRCNEPIKGDGIVLFFRTDLRVYHKVKCDPRTHVATEELGPFLKRLVGEVT